MRSLVPFVTVFSKLGCVMRHEDLATFEVTHTLEFVE
jgi:hypothetical protein